MIPPVLAANLSSSYSQFVPFIAEEFYQLPPTVCVQRHGYIPEIPLLRPPVLSDSGSVQETPHPAPRTTHFSDETPQGLRPSHRRRPVRASRACTGVYKYVDCLAN